MCGVAGIVVRDGGEFPRRVLEAMTESLAHRGPDDDGIWTSGAIGFGHRRLAIIDPDTGKQPMSNMDGSIWITYNGEIYNFRELRQDLIAEGHQFATRSDTEVVIHAWQEWGPACVERLRGMFAFAIADLERRELFLARDHLGIKPLFYVETSAFFAFASELQSLVRVPGLDLELDLKAVDDYLRLQYVPAPNTVYRRINKLRPGHRLRMPFDGPAGTPERYWHPRFEEAEKRTPEEWLEELDRALRESVEAHMVADVPFGAFLSGGIDSSAVVGYMAQILDRPVKTFSIGFEEEASSELAYAETVARQWNTDHHVEVLRPDAIGILPTLVRHYGEPFGDCSAVPTYYVSRMAAASVPMVLSGDGGDELFAGYHSYRTWARWLEYDGIPAWKRRVYPLANRLRPERYLPRDAQNLNTRLSFVEWMRTPQRRQLWKPQFRRLCEQPLPIFEEEFEWARAFSPVQRAQYLDLMTYLPFAILTKVDVASMISSLEVRTPLVDREVAELALSMPLDLNFARTEGGEYEGKLLLKRLLSKTYPDSFVRRPKMGFGTPLGAWFGPSGALREAVHDRLLSESSPLAGLFEQRVIRKLLRDSVHGSLWSLLVLDEWLAQNRQVG